MPVARICQGDPVTALSLSKWVHVPGYRSGGWRAWLGMAFVGVVFVVALMGCLLAVIALVRPSAPRTHQVHMTTDTQPRTVLLAEEIRAEGARHHLDIVLT